MCEFGVIGIYVLIFPVIPRGALRCGCCGKFYARIQGIRYICASIEYETGVFSAIY